MEKLRDSKGRFMKEEEDTTWVCVLGLFLLLIMVIILKLTGVIKDPMTYKDLIYKKGNFYCRECKKEMNFSMEVRGGLAFRLRKEGNEILMDVPDFQYDFAEATSDRFYCDNCGKEYQGARDLFDGVAEINSEKRNIEVNRIGSNEQELFDGRER